MATVVLNVATELSIEYDTRNIEISLMNMIETKWDLSMKYAQELNDTGSWFIDIIWCPTNITMSGTTAQTIWFSSDIHYAGGIVYCEWTHDGNPVTFYFNAAFTDLQYAQYEGYQKAMSSANQVDTFSDTDTTNINITASYPLSSDNIDDNFDSDNYTIYSTGTTLYPDGYVDNDADARLLNYGYVIEGSWLYNMFWSNRQMQEYIDNNPYNTDSIYTKLGDVSSGRLYFDVNKSFRLVLYKIDDAQYEATREMIIEEQLVGEWENAGIWYLQDDLSLSSTVTWSEYDFDFVNNDYALFVENTGSGALLYRIRWEDIATGSWVYLSALNDNDSSIFSYLWSHMLINDEWRLIGNQSEVFGLK